MDFIAMVDHHTSVVVITSPQVRLTNRPPANAAVHLLLPVGR